MPIDTEHHVPLGRERYRFHPWYERPLTERQLLACLAACVIAAAGIVSAAGAAVWVAGIPARWVVEPLAALFLLTLAAGCRDAYADRRDRSTQED
ncbi:MAG: hypothetical protein J2P28_09380 [Actinobacteria bacterium]|nr:hypothetical protein [Actinomycetota bacterium]